MVNAGGYEKVNSAKLWPQIAERLGYPGGKFAMAMKTNYEKLLLKYELMVTAHSASGGSGKRSANPGDVKSIPVKRTRLHAQEVRLSVLTFTPCRMIRKSTIRLTRN